MDKYLEEYDNNGGANRDRSASPSVNSSNSLLSADSKHRIRNNEASAANNNEKPPPTENIEMKVE